MLHFHNEVTATEKVDTSKKEKQLEYTAMLEIPKISLKRGIVNSTKNFNSINYAISADSNSNYPNENGNFILYAHSGNSKIAFFHNLNKLEKNDDIYVYYDGVKYHYTVIHKYNIQKAGKAKVIDSKNNKYITLITCNQKKKDQQTILVGKIKNITEY